MSIKHGVYFIANDYLIDLSIAFLNSFRCYNPDIPLCLIPYDSNYQEILKQKERFDFTVFSDPDTLEFCDEISKRFFDYICGSFRKLAMWEGPFDEFIYIDIDTIVLSNLEFSFKFLEQYDFITSHGDIDYIRKWVWKDSIYSSDILTREQINYAANTGYIISHKKILTRELILEKLEKSMVLKNHMELFCAEQPFLNFLFVTSGKYTSLWPKIIKENTDKIPAELWGGTKFRIVFRGKIYFSYMSYPILLIHWAGIYRPNNWDKRLNKLLKFVGINRKFPNIRFFMPNKRLWKYYRNMGMKRLKKVQEREKAKISWKMLIYKNFKDSLKRKRRDSDGQNISKRGVYFFVNDKMFELAVAFLNSFRMYNPEIPLCLVPYNSNFGKIAALSEKYDFTIFDDKDIIDICDKISCRFYGHVSGSFRKLAFWHGPFEEFVYIDVDTVVLNNIDFCFKYLSDYEFITSSSNLPINRKWVWKDSIYNVDVLSKEQIDYAANTGFIVSQKKALPMSLILDKVEFSVKIKEHMELWCGEQPFLNYLFVTTGRYTSLLSLLKKKYTREIPIERWGKMKFGITCKGRIFFPFDKHPTLFVHWAGIYRPGNFEKFLINFLNRFGLKIKIPVVAFFLPKKRLWKYYRNLKKIKIRNFSQQTGLLN